MSENKKPRLAEVLGVEVGERFDIAEAGNNPYYVSEFGWLVDREDNIISNWATRIINEPDLIKRRPRWTEQEAELAKALYELRRSVSLVIGRSTGGILWWRDGDRGEGILPHKLFPSLNEGNCVSLDEIIGGAE